MKTKISIYGMGGIKNDGTISGHAVLSTGLHEDGKGLVLQQCTLPCRVEKHAVFPYCRWTLPFKPLEHLPSHVHLFGCEGFTLARDVLVTLFCHGDTGLPLVAGQLPFHH